MSKFTTDLEFGLTQEQNLLELLRTFFKCDLNRTTNRNSWYDYKFGNKYFELKSRKVNSDTYKSTMISQHKIIQADKINGDVYFIFNFIDCVKYIKYDKELFSTFECKMGGRYDRGRPEQTLY